MISRTWHWACVSITVLAFSINLARTGEGGAFLVRADVAEKADNAQIKVEESAASIKEAARDGKDSAAETVTEMVNKAGAAQGEEREESEDEFLPPAEVQVLDTHNFERVTQVATGATTGDWFVEFYAPWCSHCRKLQPVWDQVATRLGGKVNVAKVDANSNGALGKRFGIKGFPTLLMFSHGEMYKYGGPRRLDDLVSFAEGGFKSVEGSPVPPPTSITGGASATLQKLVRELKDVKNGKVPSTTSLALVLMASLILLLVVAMAMPSKGASARPKVD